MKAELEGERVSIRLFGPWNAAEYFDLLLRNRSFLEPYEPARPSEYWTLAEQTSQLETAVREWETGAGYAFGIFDRADGALVGRVALANVVRKSWQNATLG